MTDLKPLSRVQRRSVETSVAVALDTLEQIAYQHSVGTVPVLPCHTGTQDRMFAFGTGAAQLTRFFLKPA